MFTAPDTDSGPCKYCTHCTHPCAALLSVCNACAWVLVYHLELVLVCVICIVCVLTSHLDPHINNASLSVLVTFQYWIFAMYNNYNWLFLHTIFYTWNKKSLKKHHYYFMFLVLKHWLWHEKNKTECLIKNLVHKIVFRY